MKIKDNKEKYTFWELYEIIKFLRSPNGCPWDRAQTHETLVKPMIEEAFEVVDAINSGSKEKLVEELGDVLLQIIFHTIIGEEEDSFVFDDVTDRCARKMIFRHSHVFGDLVADNVDEVLQIWEQRKIAEKKIGSLYEDLSAIPKNFPALMRAEKVAKKVRKSKSREEDNSVVVDFTDSVTEGKMLYNICAEAEKNGIDPYLSLQNTLEEKIEQYKEL